jgi:Rha family phage regulatory protein
MTTPSIASRIAVIDGHPTTTTLDIANVYGKRHDNVVSLVRQRMTECPEEWCLLNFKEVIGEYQNGKGGTQTCPVIRMTKKGFHFVVGKFTGAKAVQHQIAFADEFERMEAELQKQQAEQKPFVVQPEDLLSGPQQLALRTMLESNVKRLLSLEKQGEAMKKGWSKLKAHFGVSYRKIPSSQFHEALDIIARHISDLEGAINNTLTQPTTPLLPVNIEAANEAANSVAAKVQQQVFTSVLNGGQSWKHQRWMVAFISDSELSAPAIVSCIPEDACVMTVTQFTQALARNDIPATTEALVQIAQASMAEVQRRMTGQTSLRLAA